MSTAEDPEEEHADLPFAVREHAVGGATVLALEGDLDLASAEPAGEALRRAQSDGATVVLDLRGLRFMDSSGLRVVLEAQRRAADSGDAARLQVVPGEGVVRRAFELSGVGALVTMVEAPPSEAGA